MHEVSIAEGILSAVESTLVNEPDAKVSSVTVNIGELAGVESQALLFAWDSVVRGTLAEGAKLVIEQVAGEAWCMKCAKNVPLHRHGDPCPPMRRLSANARQRTRIEGRESGTCR